MLRKSCCCGMGWWGYAKRKELQSLMIGGVADGLIRACRSSVDSHLKPTRWDCGRHLLRHRH
eukprot:372851-Pyramimonas_sp.AAC.1